ncbi:MAG: hypothetical protein A2508_01585 [Candidatus Lambdaproteobacteria bacterium RIFOXYD12_FULL_49_8]|uniref:Inner membrane protein YgaP-like transmembrane domain-containing protein n=1 Tax=Candidatus Lambdaproteobacteria bacterium RIFOXYD2_FULL_50_16 TaxID=1817772 RepID=A0A1F6G871_9PROT|nr:MAG: hypothetical protein A2527_14685 [Candidatus Lambdaproteobacteria bacterium RIFOXYD2_FULL_50_16]OGG96897.1 MAG: hypothetical protein A2508_01585 [Candidatus Lambdaproteobacteria bacterium RIFOXYD12_FULL_49_8]
MKKNIGNIDRIIRIVLGVAIAAFGVIYESWLGLIAIIPIGTALIATCPLYLPLGLNTGAKDGDA